MSEKPICPYPGLRTFTEQESIYFKGREDNIRTAIELVQKNKFLMLTGSSGDGKSSMVYAGIIPQARAGIFSGEFPNWLVIDFKPKRNPIVSLAAAIHATLLPESGLEEVCAKLKLGFSALIDIYKGSSNFVKVDPTGEGDLPDKEKRKRTRTAKNLLIIVDQFEELFTNPENYSGGIPSDSSKLLVNLILETNKIAVKENIPVYIICTMRSDYFGYCSSFDFLPEIIGKSQYFIPRMTRKDIYRAIEDPALLSGNKIEPRLIERLLFDSKEGPDVLPVIQHALFRIFREYQASDLSSMDLVHYAKIGGMPVEELTEKDRDVFNKWFDIQPESRKRHFEFPSLANVLNAHANELFEDSALAVLIGIFDGKTAKKIIKHCFLGMTRMDDGKAVRSRVSIRELHKSLDDANVTPIQLRKVIEPFAHEDNSLIRTFIDGESEKKSEEDLVLDIAHEALIRNWKSLGDWIKDDYENTILLNELLALAIRWEKEKRSKEFLLSEGQTAFFLNWKNENKPGESWVGRFAGKEFLAGYGGRDLFLIINEYIDASAKVVNFKKKILKGALAIISCFLIMAVWGFYNANKQEKIASSNGRKSRSNELAMGSFLQNDANPTIALRIAEEAYKIEPSSLAKQALMDAYMNGPFYKKELRGHTGILNFIWYSNSGNYILSVSDDQSGIIWNKDGELLHKLKGHTTPVNSGEFSRDENHILTAGRDSTAILWNLKGELLKRFNHDRGNITNAQFLPDGKKLITTSANGTAKIWDLDGNCLHTTKFLGELKGFISVLDKILIPANNKLYILNPKDFSLHIIQDKSIEFNSGQWIDNNSFLTYGNGNKIGIWKNLNLSKIIQLPCKNVLYSKISPDINYAAIRTDGSEGFLINLINFKVTPLTGHTTRINFVGFNHASNKVSTCSDDRTIKIWDLSGSLIKVLKPNDITYNIDFSPDDKTLISSHNTSKGILWDLSIENYQNLKGHSDQIWGITVSPTGKYISSSGWDSKMKLWDYQDGSCVGEFIFDFKVEEATFSSDEKQLVAIGKDGLVALINLQTKQSRVLKGHSRTVHKAVFLPGNLNFVTPAGDGKIGFWDINGNQVKFLSDHKSSVSMISASSKGWFVSSSYDGTSIIWDRSGIPLKTLSGQAGAIYKNSISKDDQFIATASLEGEVFVWDSLGNKLNSLKLDEEISCVSFANKNSNFITFGCQSGKIGIWNFKENTNLLIQNQKDFVNVVQFSENDDYILSASDDGLAILQDLQGNIITAYKGHKGGIQTALFSRDWKNVLTGGVDGTIKKWPLFFTDVIKWIKEEDKNNRLYRLNENEKRIYNLVE